MTSRTANPARRRLLRLSALLALAPGLPAAAAAAAPAAGAPRLKLATTTGFAAGGSSDVTARLLADHLRGAYAETVLVDSRVGAAGRLAVEHVKGGAADGSSLLVSPSGMMVLFPHIYRSLRYDPLKDFTPVVPLAKFPFVLAVSGQVPQAVATLADFVAWCRAHPQQASFGSPGAGTSAHFSGIMLGRLAGFDYVHAPYRGMAPLVADLMGGQIASGVLTPAEALPLAESGRLRLLASTGAERSALMPGVPTYRELGYPDIHIEESYSLYAPAAVPPEVIAQLSELAARMLARPEVQARFAQMGLEVAGGTPGQFRASLERLHARWAGIVQASGFTPND